MPFRNSIVAGEALVRTAIASPNYAAGVSGWRIAKDGSAEFNNVTVRGSIIAGTIDIGGNDATSFHVDATGNLWLGAATFAAAPFTVTSTGVLTASGATITGTITGATISGGTISGATISGNTVSGNTISGGTIAGTTITGTTITGGTIQTAASGARIVLDGTNSDRISFYDAGGTLRHHISGTSSTLLQFHAASGFDFDNGITATTYNMGGNQIIDGSRNITGAVSLTINGGTASITSAGVISGASGAVLGTWNAGSSYQLNGTTVIDSSRALQNITGLTFSSTSTITGTTGLTITLGGGATGIKIGGGLDKIGFNSAPVARPTWAAWSGTATRTTVATGTATTAQCAQAIKAIIDDLRSNGLFA